MSLLGVQNKSMKEDSWFLPCLGWPWRRPCWNGKIPHAGQCTTLTHSHSWWLVAAAREKANLNPFFNHHVISPNKTRLKRKKRKKSQSIGAHCRGFNGQLVPLVVDKWLQLTQHTNKKLLFFCYFFVYFAVDLVTSGPARIENNMHTHTHTHNKRNMKIIKYHQLLR